MTCYVVLEGPDGCGKSAQATALVQWLHEQGHRPVHLREPGSTKVGETLRALLLGQAHGSMLPLTEALLFSAARAEMLAQQVAPALAAGAVVVAERSFLSTMVYQGEALPPGEGVPAPVLWQLAAWAHGTHGILWPDAILVLDVDAGTARERQRGRARDRIEARGDAFHERVRQGFLALAGEGSWLRASLPQHMRLCIVDAAGSLTDVQRALRHLVEPLLARPSA